MAPVIGADRLVLRPWTSADASAALAIFGTPEVAARLYSATGPVDDVSAMRVLLTRWMAQDAAAPAPTGHWALELRAGRRLVGGLSLELAAWDPKDVRVTWKIAPGEWGNGYAVEACTALLRWATHEAGVNQVFAVIPLDDIRAAATAERVGMEQIHEIWPGKLRVYRIGHGELDDEEP